MEVKRRNVKEKSRACRKKNFEGEGDEKREIVNRMIRKPNQSTMTISESGWKVYINIINISQCCCCCRRCHPNHFPLSNNHHPTFFDFPLENSRGL